MPGATGRGVPYPLDGDPAADGNERIQEIAEWVDARPGISALTTAQRDALAGVELWNGRYIYNTSTAMYERYYTAPYNAWQPVALPVMATGTRDALGANQKYVGLMIYNSQSTLHEYWDGAVWRQVGPLAMTTAQRDALGIAAKPTGRVIYNTDTKQLDAYDGAAWNPVGSAFLYARSFLVRG